MPYSAIKTNVDLVPGNNTITFATALDSAGYTLVYTCMRADDEKNEALSEIVSRTAVGFVINVSVNAKLSYFALIYGSYQVA
jgi:hypothetical protein